jgi:hypothetical protein
MLLDLDHNNMMSSFSFCSRVAPPPQEDKKAENASEKSASANANASESKKSQEQSHAREKKNASSSDSLDCAAAVNEGLMRN